MPKYIEEIVSRQVQKSEIAKKSTEQKYASCPNLVVTISRHMGSGARIIAETVASDLGWSLWDRDLLDAMAEDADVSRQVVEQFDEKTISEIELFARSAMGDHEVSGFMYLRHLAKAVAAISKLGNAIILGRGANFLLPQALNIRIDESFDKRVRNMMEFEQMTKADAENQLKKSDKDRDSFLAKTFGKQRVENEQYDLVIWMDKFSNEGAIDIVKSAIECRCQIVTK